MPVQDRNLIWWHEDEGLAPSAARQPWEFRGGGTAQFAPDGDGYQISVAPVDIGGAFFARPMGENDRVGTGPLRNTDRAVMQWVVKGIAEGGGNWPALHAGFAAIDDKVRPVGVMFGTQLRWVSTDGTDLGLIDGNFPWLRRNVFMLVKERGELWRLFVNGRLLSELPWGHAPSRNPTRNEPAEFIFGIGDPLGAIAAEARWYQVEAGLNQPVPPEWIYERERFAAPPPVLDEWSPRHRAIWRTIVAQAQGVVDAQEEVSLPDPGWQAPVRNLRDPG